MGNDPSKDQSSAPAPEVLNAKSENPTPEPATGDLKAHVPASPKKRRSGSYRPSHRATFIGLAVVILILAANVGVVAFLIQKQNKKIQSTQGNVTISQAALDKIGVNQTPVGDAGIILTVNPNAHFNGTVQIAGNVSVGGLLNLNKPLTVSNANITQLAAGNTAVSQLNVNGDGTMSNLNLRSSLVVTGNTRLQGPTTLSQLLTVNAGVNVSGDLTVGGTFAVNSFHASSLVSDFGLTFGGHAVTEGSAPTVSAGGAIGSNGTVSISGNDAAGTVAVNVGANPGSGVVAFVTFRSGYTNIPHVVVTAVGGGADDVYVDRSTSGFDIGVGSITTGGHAFDYIVEQ